MEMSYATCSFLTGFRSLYLLLITGQISISGYQTRTKKTQTKTQTQNQTEKQTSKTPPKNPKSTEIVTEQ